ncbi:MAG: formimidoylglutamate deiminase [Holophagales bacterium]|nr:formimidoylglutamate deiminase [Holophagales bacterium]
MKRFTCDHLFTGRRWLEHASLEVDGSGRVASLATSPGLESTDSGEHLPGVVVPGIPNLHSHAHQRAMAGLAERSGAAGRDSFWSWREEMYRLLATLGPDELEAIAAQLYLEMLEAGYTSVGEFQYLHHGPTGEPYARPAEMTLRCLAAAREVGIGFTALPVFYAHGGFGGQAPEPGQRRFVCDLELYARLLEDLGNALRPGTGERHEGLGIAPHSLRATTAEELHGLLALAGDDMPVHIHVAEQVKEVDDCLAWSGHRPVHWLLDHAPVDSRWCLIHATHLDDAEVERLAGTEAVVGLCPITEANLGDGTFRAGDFLSAGGRFGIGSDSHIRIDPAEEMRWLEYGQRLRDLGRNVLAGSPGRSTGRRILERVLEGGARACALDALPSTASGLEPGARADFLVLDPDSPQLACRRGDELLDSWIFAGSGSPVRDVYVGGRRVVADGRHPRREPVLRRFRATLERVRART